MKAELPQKKFVIIKKKELKYRIDLKALQSVACEDEFKKWVKKNIYKGKIGKIAIDYTGSYIHTNDVTKQYNRFFGNYKDCANYLISSLTELKPKVIPKCTAKTPKAFLEYCKKYCSVSYSENKNGLIVSNNSQLQLSMNFNNPVNDYYEFYKYQINNISKSVIVSFENHAYKINSGKFARSSPKDASHVLEIIEELNKHITI
jgi:hypothetical protein